MTLTPKQKMFATKVASGSSQSQAYREAYGSSGKSGTLRTESSRLANKPEIAAFIKRQREKFLLKEVVSQAKELKLIKRGRAFPRLVP
jgi:phage terminase small subunit